MGFFGGSSPMIGKVITRDELKARWAYAESRSSRFKGQYEPLLPPDLFTSANNGRPFDQISREEWPELIAALERERISLIGFLGEPWGASEFKCVGWDVPGLLSSPAMGNFFADEQQRGYFCFLAWPTKQTHDGKADTHDPRYAAAGRAFDRNFRVEEPLIAVRSNGHHILIDGYLRSILWLRNPVEPLPVWVPNVP